MKIQSISDKKIRSNIETRPQIFYSINNKASLNELRSNQVSFNGLFDSLKIKLKAKENKKDAALILAKSKEIQNKADEIMDRSKDLQQASQSIVRKSARIYIDIKTAMDIARANGISAEVNPKNEESIRAFKQDGNKFVMSEYLDGFLLRKAILEDNKLTVTEFAAKRDNQYIFDTKAAQLLQYRTGITRSAVGYRADRVYSFKDNQMITFDEQYHTKPSSYESAEEHYVYKNGSIAQCFMNYHDDFDGFKKAQEVFEFKKGRITNYTNGLRHVEGAVKQKDESFSFFEDKLYLYSQDLKQAEEGADEADKIYIFNNEKLINAKFGYHLGPKGTEKSDEVFYYNPETGKFREYLKNKVTN